MKCYLIFLLALLMLAACEPTNVRQNAFSGESGGCGSFVVYQGDGQRQALAVIGWRDSLDLTGQPQTFDLATVNPDWLRVELIRANSDPALLYCNDVVMQGVDTTARWRAVSGQVHIRIPQDSIRPNGVGGYHYFIDLTVENLELHSDTKGIRRIERVEFGEVFVGWLPG